MPPLLKNFRRRIFQRFFRTNRLGGLVLLGFGLAVLAVANSLWSEPYQHFCKKLLGIDVCIHCYKDGHCEPSTRGKLESPGRVWGNWFHDVTIHCMLAFDNPALIDAAKRGIIVGSLLAGVADAVMLQAAGSRHVD